MLVSSAYLFQDLSTAASVVDTKVDKCEPLKLTPKKLYSEIKSLAEKRYQYTLLPKKLSQLNCLDKQTDKVSLLKDTCLAIGLTIHFGPRSKIFGDEREIVLENDSQKMKELISRLLSKNK